MKGEGFMRNITESEARSLFETHSCYVHRIAFLLTKSDTMADDITQETFIRVFDNFKMYNPHLPIEPWIYKITINVTRNLLRRNKFKFVSWSEHEDPSHEESIERQVVKNETSERLKKKINKLPQKSKEVIVLHFYAELKLSEVAEALEIPIGTCKSRLNHALKLLRRSVDSTWFKILKRG